MTQSLISRVEMLEAKLRLAEHAIRDLEAAFRLAFKETQMETDGSDTEEMDSDAETNTTKEEEVPKN